MTEIANELRTAAEMLAKHMSETGLRCEVLGGAYSDKGYVVAQSAAHLPSGATVMAEIHVEGGTFVLGMEH